MKSRKAIAILMGLMLLGTAGLSACNFDSVDSSRTEPSSDNSSDIGSDDIPDPVEKIENAVEDGKSYVMPEKMAFTSTSLLAANETGVTVTLVATVEPADAPDKSVDWSVNWSDDATLKENDITQYLTVTPQTDGSTTASVNCKQPFGDDTIVITVTTRDGGYQANCMVTFVGIPTSITITTDMTQELDSVTGLNCYTLGVDRTTTLTVTLDNAFHSVSESYYEKLQTKITGPEVVLGDETQTTDGEGVTTSTWADTHTVSLTDKASEFITATLSGHTISVEAKRKIETYYASVSYNGRSALYRDKFKDYAVVRSFHGFSLRIFLSDNSVTAKTFDIKITSSVTNVSLDGTLKF